MIGEWAAALATIAFGLYMILRRNSEGWDRLGRVTPPEPLQATILGVFSMLVGIYIVLKAYDLLPWSRRTNFRRRKR
jgi:uncharacterized membrane protein YfcA